MEKNLDDCEFWLPPQFLTDDELLMDFKTHSVGFNPFGSNSDLSSPVESVVGSTETESDEDDYITGLTRKMAHSTIQEAKGLSLSRSPQSTLCGCKQGSSRGSTNCPSQASSPPRTNRGEVSMDLLYAAAGEVARIRMMEDSAGIWAAPPRKTSPVPVGPKNSKPNLTTPFSSNQPPLSYQQIQLAQFQRLKQQQMMKQMAESTARNGGAAVRGNLNLSNSAWPTLQQSQQQQTNTPAGSGMRAVFLGNPGPKRECAGTGVFLPRRIGTPSESRKKPGCPVILPERVVQALNLNLEVMDAAAAAAPHPQVQTRCHAVDTDGGLKYRSNMAVAAQQRRNQRTHTAAMPQELQLPQEWTY